MYLKELEIVGFKSFAEKTKLSFEPGMTCIVGPNGCGKSNVSDAIRWVLGEQSAKALRGGTMQDVIFNGTDTHKPLSMAEVSLTLADCTGTLDLEYDEVKLTRRVLRSGEGQYYINKSPCRLKDIQRLFMDTGVGTNSYSVLEQGKIDQILSSRPDDRRAIFEEASGITRYKADRKEALRKLDHTEANLLRLDDIIREVKRQIGSLQRQAGKARRYKVMQGELRGLDIFATRERIKHLDEDLKQLGNQISSLEEQDEAATEELEKIEKRMEELRGQLETLEKSIAEAMDSTAEAQSANNRNQQAIDLNRERVVEFKTLLNRDHEDAEKSKTMLTHHVETRTKLTEDRDKDQENLKAFQESYDTEAASQKGLEDKVDTARKELHQLRSHSVDLDSHIARIQNELADMDAREQSNTLKRERLSAEKSQAERSVEQFNQREKAMSQELETLRSNVKESETNLQTIEQQRQGSRESAQSQETQLNEVGQKLTGIRTRLEVIEAAKQSAEGYDKGARFLLEENQDQILGSLADMVSTDGEYTVALQAALSSSLTALVVENTDVGIALLDQLIQGNKGAVKLICATGRDYEIETTPSYAQSLRSLVTVAPGAEALADSLLSNVWVVDALNNLPDDTPESASFVTRDGRVLRGNGSLELYAQGSIESNPMARRQKQDELEKQRETLTTEQTRIQQDLDGIKQDRQTLDERIGQARHQLQEARRALANKEGEAQMISNESRQVTRRLDTVSFELKALIEKTSGGTERRQNIVETMEGHRKELTDVRGQVQARTEELRHIEERRSEQLNKTAEQRVLLSEARQRVQQTEQQLQSQSSRIQELDEMIQNRSRGAAQYTQRIQALEAKIQYAVEQATPLAKKIEDETEKLAQLRDSRLKASQELHLIESDLRNKRQQADAIRSRKNTLKIEQTEKSTRRQTAFERLATDYQVSLEDIMQASEPEWEDGERPDRDSLETRIAELRAQLESLGPVNLVAIEEHQELEERYAFLTQQQQDLINSKAQLIEMIKKINLTTTELFRTTFDKVNQNFKETFTKLFGGGSAKLVMLDEEDVLETGIEIIARPPGKKLQTVSLLSGGERTMTAVALLFALFMVKPSPFCVLDEMDAALDDSNITRFVSMVQEFLTISQFVVITHSRITIAAGDVLYGVTMQTRGISKVVSVKMREKGEPELIEEKKAEPVEAPA